MVILMILALVTSAIAPAILLGLLMPFRGRDWYRLIWGAALLALICWASVALGRFHTLATWYADPHRYDVPGGEGFGRKFYHTVGLLQWILWFLPSFPCVIAAVAVRSRRFRFGGTELAMLLVFGGTLFGIYRHYWDLGARDRDRRNKWLAVGAGPGFAPDGTLTGLNYRGDGPASLKALRGETALTFLSLTDRTIDPSEWQYLASLKNLTGLYLHGTNITDDDLVHLEHLKALEKLDLDHTHLTDRGMASVGKLTGLTFLYIRDTGVTDAGIKQLSSLTNLKQLYVDGDRVTGDGFREFRLAKCLAAVSLRRTPVNEAGLREIAKLPAICVVDIPKDAIRPVVKKQIEEEVRARGKSFGIHEWSVP